MELEIVSCDLCGFSDYTNLLTTQDHRLGIEGDFSIVRCRNCGLIYTNPRPSLITIKKLYEDYYDSKDSSSNNQTEINFHFRKLWHRINGGVDLRDLKIKGRVLEIGCGQGRDLQFFKSKGSEIYGVEINSIRSNTCKQKGLNVYNGTLAEAKFPDNHFDVVLMSQVLEHLPSPYNTMKEVFRVLKLGGKVYIFSPNVNSYLRKILGRYWSAGWHIPFHFYHFSDESIKLLASKTGFEVEKIDSVTPDYWFTMSLRTFLFKDANKFNQHRLKILDSILVRFIISLIIRVFDTVTSNGDCLKVTLNKSKKEDNEKI